jgi:hypothetical protein
MTIENIAEEILRDVPTPAPPGGKQDAAAQITRLWASRAVVDRWVEAAGTGAGETAALWRLAKTARDEIDEALAGAYFRLDLEESKRLAPEGLADEVEAAAISDGLLTAFTVLLDAPERLFHDRGERLRYELMGALMAASEAVGEPEPEKPRT